MIRAIMLIQLVVLVCLPAFAETRACAHRGDAKAAPENTLPAIQSAVDKGAHMIEFDVGVSKDGQLVICMTIPWTARRTAKVKSPS